jgi:hypothetical protein
MDPTETQVTLSDFPRELVYHILDEGARMYPKLAYTLCLVSRWTRALSLPHLYSGATLKTVSQSTKFSTCLKESFTLKENPHIFDPKDHLRGVWIGPASSRVVEIFRLADHLTSLALSVDNLEWLINGSVRLPVQRRMLPPRSFKMKPNLRLLVFNEEHHDWRWTFEPGTLAPETDDSPLFSKVTHIQLSEYLRHEDIELELAHWANLSHLAIPYRPGALDYPTNVYQTFLDSESVVSTLVLVVYTDILPAGGQERAMEEIRVFGSSHPGRVEYAVCKRQDLQKDWEYEQRGGASIWDRAQPAFEPKRM